MLTGPKNFRMHFLPRIPVAKFLQQSSKPELKQHTWDWYATSTWCMTSTRVPFHCFICWITMWMQIIHFRCWQRTILLRISIHSCGCFSRVIVQYCIAATRLEAEILTGRTHWFSISANGTHMTTVLRNNFWIKSCWICKCHCLRLFAQCCYVIVWLWSMKTKMRGINCS